MEVPVKNIVDTVELTGEDVLLPMLECVVNSIISLQQSPLPPNERKIQIQIIREGLPKILTTENLKIISDFKIIDNGVGFNDKNYNSFKTPFSQVNIEYGCKGIGRFTVLAAYKNYNINSNYKENGLWHKRSFSFSTDKEIQVIEDSPSHIEEWKTVVHISKGINPELIDVSALSISHISEKIMQHCFIYYLNNTLPHIEIYDIESKTVEVINELFEKVSKDNERSFQINEETFKFYITKTGKEGNRKNNYLHYCANNRTVGNPKNLKLINSIFSYPVLISGNSYYLDIYLVSDFLNRKVYKTRNGFNIPKDYENLLFADRSLITFQSIDENVSSILENLYNDYVRYAKEKNIEQVKSYISNKAPRYNSFLNNEDILNAIPANLTEDKLEEHLYKVSFNARKSVENKIDTFIKNKAINEDAINAIIDDIKTKTAYDVDSLADYMTRRKAIINLFDKFLDADENGQYKLEEDIHKLIFPLGLSNNDLHYENHNLWLLDERFITYKFIASDKSITSYTQIKSSKEPDLLLLDKPKMFDNPISFGDKVSGEISSMVIFEFKRPGGIAHQKNKNDFRWEFSELVEPYFDEFIYANVKKNYKGNQVIIKQTTPKFGYIILDFIPDALANYNKGKSWKHTPFGTFYKILPDLNLHLEVITFRQLIDAAKQRHNPFFNKMFT